MATKKTAAPLRPQDIAIAGKSKKDATLLATFVAQQGQAAWPLLDDVLGQGSAVMRRAAVEQMAKLDPRRAERAVRAALRETAAKTGRAVARDRHERLGWLLRVGTPSAVQLFLDEGGEGESELGPATAALFRYAAGRVASLDPAGVKALLKQIGLGLYAHAAWVAGSDEARALARALLDHDEPAVQERGAWLLCEVDAVKALATLRQLGHPASFDRVLELCRWAPSEVQLDELSGYLADPEARERVVAVLRPPLDPRWLPRLEPHLDEPAVVQLLARCGHPGALARLRADAARDVFDSLTQRACYQLGLAGDREATPHLLRWLADPRGRQASPLLLTALGACGGPDAIPVIEGLMRHEPGRANFYQHAVASIRERAAGA